MTKPIPQDNAIYSLYCYTCKTGFINMSFAQKQSFPGEHPGHKFTGMVKHEQGN